MPLTVPVRIEDTPTFGNFPGEAGAVRYGEGLLVGYRWYDSRDIEVSVPFGHGGSYTTFDWSGIRLSANELEIGVGEPVSVEVTVINTGDRPGSEVVQVYVAPPETTPVFRPRRELKGFARVDLEPGERRRLVIDLDWRSFAYWTPHDTSAAYHERVLSTPFASTVPGRVAPEGWTVVGGDYRVQVARSVTDIEAELPLRLAGSIEGRR
jgi:hypothetical protein